MTIITDDQKNHDSYLDSDQKRQTFRLFSRYDNTTTKDMMTTTKLTTILVNETNDSRQNNVPTDNLFLPPFLTPTLDNRLNDTYTKRQSDKETMKLNKYPDFGILLQNDSIHLPALTRDKILPWSLAFYFLPFFFPDSLKWRRRNGESKCLSGRISVGHFAVCNSKLHFKSTPENTLKTKLNNNS